VFGYTLMAKLEVIIIVIKKCLMILENLEDNISVDENILHFFDIYSFGMVNIYLWILKVQNYGGLHTYYYDNRPFEYFYNIRLVDCSMAFTNDNII